MRKICIELTRGLSLLRNKGLVLHVPHLIDSGWSDEMLQWSGHVTCETDDAICLQWL
jgi:hypothetical protein